MKKSNIGRNYGWKRQNPDFRDKVYAVKPRTLATLPAIVDMRSQCPPVYDQGSLGSCTANAIGAAHQFEQLKEADKDAFAPSRLFIYYNERAMEGTINEDAGAIIRDGLKTAANDGVCPESMWAYDTGKFTKKPSANCYTNAANHQVTSYFAPMQTLDYLKGVLAEGYPFVFGFAVYESFETAEVARTGMMPMPKPSEKCLGGHAVMCVGYDDSKQCFIVRNSWGDSWGKSGYFYMPYDYMADPNLCSDFWTIKLVEDEDCPTPNPDPNPTPDPVPPTPTPDPTPSPCDCSMALPSVRAFVDGIVHASDRTMKSGVNASASTLLVEGFRNLQRYLQKVEELKKRHK